MNVVVTSEHRFFRIPDGSVWTQGLNAYNFWTRYLSVFDGVKVVARVAELEAPRDGFRPASGAGVTFQDVPNYVGPWQYLRKAPWVHRAVYRSVSESDACVMRVSSHIGACLESVLTRARRPYGLEVVNDPFDVFAPGAVRYRLRPLFRAWFSRQLRRQCRAAVAVAYVTERALQERYPCAAYSVGMSDVEIDHDTILEKPAVFTTHYSSVELSKEDAVSMHRTLYRQRRSYRLVTVASLAQMYKAPDILIQAIARCVSNGLDVKLHIVGDGKHRSELERLASRLGIQDRVIFVGQLPSGAAVRAQLDGSDLFVLPSRCEGLPRAMIEAMARSLPCIGSAVGGIPELLAPEDLVKPGSVDSLSAKIQEVLSSADRMAAMSSRNLQKAQEYREDKLAARRRAFYEHVRQMTAEWLRMRVRGGTLASAPAR